MSAQFIDCVYLRIIILTERDIDMRQFVIVARVRFWIAMIDQIEGIYI